jgi:tetratricopeptide (TPR) repeat protein
MISLSSLMDSITSNANAVFSATAPTQDQVDAIATSALSRGLTDYTNGDIDGAIVELKNSIAFSPYSDNSLTAFKYLATAYEKQDKTSEAINAYKQASGLFPTDDELHSKLGLIYFNQKDYESADAEYSKAVKIDPNVSSSVYSLGQVYIAEGRYTDAETQFKKVILISPDDPSGSYALGQTYRKMGRYDEAVAQLNTAIEMDSSYSEAYLELGKTYADMKQPDKANEQVSALSDLAKFQSDTTSQSSSQAQATELQNYITKFAAPKFVAAYSSNGFITSSGSGTHISSIYSDLSSPNSSRTFTMNFSFSKEMDASSVQNLSNWLISRASGSETGGAYNWGLDVKSSELSISPIPLNVTYNSKTLTAQVTFQLTQNSEGNGTLDPSHIMFKFSGVDTYGNAMSVSANQYSGISKII